MLFLGIISKEAMQTLTAKKQPRQTMAQSRTAEKVLKPLTIAEMRADIQGTMITCLIQTSPHRAGSKIIVNILHPLF